MHLQKVLLQAAKRPEELLPTSPFMVAARKLRTVIDDSVLPGRLLDGRRSLQPVAPRLVQLQMGPVVELLAAVADAAQVQLTGENLLRRKRDPVHLGGHGRGGSRKLGLLRLLSELNPIAKNQRSTMCCDVLFCLFCYWYTLS